MPMMEYIGDILLCVTRFFRKSTFINTCISQSSKTRGSKPQFLEAHALTTRPWLRTQSHVLFRLNSLTVKRLQNVINLCILINIWIHEWERQHCNALVWQRVAMLRLSLGYVPYTTLHFYSIKIQTDYICMYTDK